MEDRAPVVSPAEQSSTTISKRQHEGRGAWVLTAYSVSARAVWSFSLLLLGLHLALVSGCGGERACASADKAFVCPACPNRSEICQDVDVLQLATSGARFSTQHRTPRKETKYTE